VQPWCTLLDNATSVASYVPESMGEHGSRDGALSNGNAEGPERTSRSNLSADRARSAERVTVGSTSESLDPANRHMQGIRTDEDRVTGALRHWQKNFSSARKSSTLSKQARDTLASSIMLWHLSQLQLKSPLLQLHAISYRAVEHKSADAADIRQVLDWASSKDATSAVRQAAKTCELLSTELERLSANQANFNFLAFAALHHATVVLWTSSELGVPIEMPDPCPGQSVVFWELLRTRDTSSLLHECSKLFVRLSVLGGTSFASAAERLSASSFPSTAINALGC